MIAGLLLPSASMGQAPTDAIAADTVIPLEGVVVSTVRPTTTTGGSSALVVSPDSLYVVPAPTLQEVLRELPFVAVRENSRGQAEITIRGSESRQVAVLLDGIPLTLGWDHRTDPSIVPITGARRITVVRGLHSVLYGPNVLGGVVEVGIAQHLPPGRAGAERGYQLGFGLDEHGSTAINAVVGGTARTARADWVLRAGAGFRDRSAVAVPAAAGDTLSRISGRRANSDLRHLDSFVSARYHAVDGRWLGLTASGYTARRGVPPELHVARPRLWRYPEESRLLAIAPAGSGHRTTRWGTGDVEASIGLDLGRTEIDRYESPAYERVIGGESGAGRTATIRLLGDHTIPAGGTITGAVTYADVRHHDEPEGEEAAVYRQRLWSAATELTRPVGRSGRVSAGLALDGADTPESGGRPPLGVLRDWGARLGASLLIRENARAHAAVSRRARFPSLRELYSGALGRFEPNPVLRPETLLGAEAGVTAHLHRLEVQAVAFHHRLSDAVARTVTRDGRFRRENQDEIRSTGLELLGALTAGSVRVRGDLLAQNVRLLNPRVEGGPARPEHRPPLRAGATLEMPIGLDIGAVVAASYTAAQYCVHPDTGSDTRLSSGAVLDVGLKRVWTGRAPVRVSAFVDNLSDSAVFDQCGLPRPGRTFRVAVHLG